jgi:hypothetical protein
MKSRENVRGYIQTVILNTIIGIRIWRENLRFSSASGFGFWIKNSRLSGVLLAQARVTVPQGEGVACNLRPLSNY